MDFPLTLAACKAAEMTLWKIGDALIAECGPPGEDGVHNDSHDKLVQCQAVLTENGYEYKIERLRTLRRVAHSFPPDSRESGISFTVHMEAGNPQTLQRILAGLTATQKKKLGQGTVQQILDGFVDQHRADRQAKGEALAQQIEKLDGQRDKLIATLESSSASNLAKTRARNSLRAVEQDIHKAKVERTKAVLPVSRGNVEVEPEEIPVMLASMQLNGLIDNALLELRKALKMCEERGSELTTVQGKATVERCMMVADTAHQIVNMVRGTKTAQGHTLSVVGGE